MKKAIFASIGAAIGPFVGGWLFRILFPATEAQHGLPLMMYVAVMLGGVLFALLGLWCGYLGAQPKPDDTRTKKGKAIGCAIGAAIGPFMGGWIVYTISVVIERMGGHANEWTGLASMFIGVAVGFPLGSILFCLLGLKIGSAITKTTATTGPESGGAR